MENLNPNPQQPKDAQPLELLKREDVRTLAKDLAKARNQESLQERAKIGNLPEKGGQSPQVGTVPTPAAPAATEPPTVFSMPASSAGGPDSAAAPKPRGGKLFIRIILVLVILFVLANAAALIFFLSSQNKEEPAPGPQTQQPTLQPLQVPAPAFALAKEEQIEVAKTENLTNALSNVYSQTRTSGFTRIVFVVPQESRIWTSQEFLTGLHAQVPQEISSNLQENLTLFVHTNAQNRQRMGFAMPLKEGSNIQQALRTWESSVEQALSSFFSFQGQKDSFAVSFFRDTTYKGVAIRFQTFSNQDFGLVYAETKNTLVITSGLESMKAVLDAI